MNDADTYWQLVRDIGHLEAAIKSLLTHCPPGHPYHERAVEAVARFAADQASLREDLALLLADWKRSEECV
jgi:hypothetical protein